MGKYWVHIFRLRDEGRISYGDTGEEQGCDWCEEDSVGGPRKQEVDPTAADIKLQQQGDPVQINDIRAFAWNLLQVGY